MPHALCLQQIKHQQGGLDVGANRNVTDWGGNIVALAITIFVNGLANGLPLGGQTTGEISDKYPSLFTPAGYVFSIWGLIYLGLIVFVIWQALPRQRSDEKLRSVRVPFLVSCACNAAWIFAWHFDFLVLSLALMAGILGSLILIYRRLEIGQKPAPAPAPGRWAMHLTFSIYLAWISVASIANVSALQISRGWDDLLFSAATWTVIKIAIAGSIAATVLFRRGDAAFMLVVVWASIGIAAAHTDVPMVVGASSTLALVGLFLCGGERLSRLKRGQV